MNDSIAFGYTFAYILIYLIAIIFFILGCYLYKKSKETIKWNKTKGSISDSKLDELIMETDSPITYKARVRYSYTIDGEEYISKRIFFGDFIRGGSQFSSRKLLKKYTKGAVVDVYYNPLKPEESVLEKGIHFNVVLLFITSFALVTFAIFFNYLVKSS